MGLSAGGLIRGGGGGGLICESKIMASEMTAATDTTRQNENLSFEKNEENVSYYSSIGSLKKICT